MRTPICTVRVEYRKQHVVEEWRWHSTVLEQRQRNKGAKDWESGGRGIVPGALLKLLVKDELPHSREVPVNPKDGSWKSQGDRRLQRMSTNQHERLAVETPEERERRLQRMRTNQHERLAVEIHEEKDYSGWEPTSTKGWQLKSTRRKITVDENQPAWKVGSWNPRGETLQWMSTNQHERLAAETPEERERRLQRMRINQHKRLAVEIHEEKDYSGWEPTSTKGWQLKSTRRKITVDEHQPARKVGSWNSWEESHSGICKLQHESLGIINLADTWWKTSYPVLQYMYFQNCNRLLLLIHVVFCCSLRLAPRCLASTLKPGTQAMCLPSLACFIQLAFTIIYGSGRPAKNREGLGAFITWMMSCGRGRGAPTTKTTHWIICWNTQPVFDSRC